jgi:peptide/nickel transport system substrate-binding protein
MFKKKLFILVGILIILSTVFAACTTSTSTSTQPAKSTSTAISAPPSSSVSTQQPPTSANWWDKFGKPQYGGTITIAVTQVGAGFDPLSPGGGGYFYDPMFYSDWTLDRNIWNFKGAFIPDQYIKGNLVENWEITDPQTITTHIRKGIKWQNKPPVNGREFTAYDAQAHFARAMSPSNPGAGQLSDWQSITASDNYTLVYKFKKASGLWLQAIATNNINDIEAPEWVALGGPPDTAPAGPPGGGPPAGPPPEPKLPSGPLGDWKQVVGTGPWMLTDFIVGSSSTYSKNPNYFGHDERYPENQLPYADKLVSVTVPDASTRIAGFRTGKFEYLGMMNTAIDWKQAASLSKTNPDLMQGQIPNMSFGVAMRLDTKPFTDINVRKALDMAIDRQSIAKGYYGGNATGKPSGLILTSYKGYCYAYDDWPQSLKDEYAYNPAKAKEVLAQAGYPDGYQTNVIASNALDLDALQLMKSEFNDIGVDMTINVMDPVTYDNMRRSSKDDQMVAEYGSFSWPLTRVVEQFYSKGMDRAETMIDDPTYDSLHDQFYSAPDAVAAQKVAVALDKYVIEQHYLVTVGESYAYLVWQPYFKGYSSEYLFSDGWITLARLWVDQSK